MADLWNLIILNPMLNGLIALSSILFSSFGGAILVLTIIVRLILYPLTIKQTKSTKAMQELQPKIQELQKKYGKNQQKLQQETMKLYREAGINPAGCVLPLVIQFPVWIALYQSIMRALFTTPENLLGLAQHLYNSSVIAQALPLSSHFLWLDLGSPDSTLLLAVIVGGTMWVQQKMTTAPATDPRQKSMNNMMLVMMPFMFAIFTMMFPSGLALFWAASNAIGIAIQYKIMGWGYLKVRHPS
ncbi:MAG: membrane protein insertase YidC [Dehalococcoidia bacterium]|nr:membrane protein insertase YidC [Dehalococcoidia bacterium]